MGQFFGKENIIFKLVGTTISLGIGSHFKIGGQGYTILSPVTKILSGLTAHTIYRIYAELSGGSIILTELTTDPSANTDKRLVGAVFTDKNGDPVVTVSINDKPQSAIFSEIPTPAEAGNWVDNISYKWVMSLCGEKLYLDVSFALSGTPTTAVLGLNMPSNLVFDESKTSNAPRTTIVGKCAIHIGSTNRYQPFCLVEYITGLAVSMPARFWSQDPSLSLNEGTLVSQASPASWGNFSHFEFNGELPIVGWSNTPLIER